MGGHRPRALDRRNLAGWLPVTAQVPDPTPEIVAKVLALTTEQGTVRDYLAELLASLWLGEADPKYGMTGESDWHYDLYGPMRDAGLIPQWRDGYGIGYRPDGSHVKEDRQRADVLIVSAMVWAITGGMP